MAGVVAVTTGNRLRKLVHTKRGRLDLRSVEWPMKLPELAGRYDASWAVELAAGALEELVERFSERLRPRQEYLEQALELARALRELEAEGLVAMWPKRFADIPVPGSRVINTALDMFCGEGRAIALGVFSARRTVHRARRAPPRHGLRSHRRSRRTAPRDGPLVGGLPA